MNEQNNIGVDVESGQNDILEEIHHEKQSFRIRYFHHVVVSALILSAVLIFIKKRRKKEIKSSNSSSKANTIEENIKGKEKEVGLVVNKGNAKIFILFDLDDTLYPQYNTLPIRIKRVVEYYQKFLKEPPCIDELKSLFYEYGSSFKGVSVKLDKGELELKDNYENKEGFSYIDFNTFLMSYTVDFLKSHMPETFRKELKEIITRLNNIPNVELWLFTNGTINHSRNCLNYLGLKDFFPESKMITANHLNDFESMLTKKYPQAFSYAEDIMKYEEKDTIIFLDDSQCNIKNAKDRSWNAILVSKNGTDEEIVIENRDILKEINKFLILHKKVIEEKTK